MAQSSRHEVKMQISIVGAIKAFIKLLKAFSIQYLNLHTNKKCMDRDNPTVTFMRPR